MNIRSQEITGKPNNIREQPLFSLKKRVGALSDNHHEEVPSDVCR